MSNTTYAPIRKCGEELMVSIPPAIVEYLQLEDKSVLEFCLGDALVTLWKGTSAPAPRISTFETQNDNGE